MTNIKCASSREKIGLKQKSPDKAMANTIATILGHQGIGMRPMW